MAQSAVNVVFRIVVLSLAGAILVFLGVGALLPDRWVVTSERTVAASPAAVAALVGDLRTWERWSEVAIELGPNTTRTVSGAPNAPGQRIAWAGERGKAALAVTALDGGRLAYEIGFEVTAPGSMAKGTVTWTAEGDRCRVRWVDEGVYSDLFLRWFGWFGALQERIKQFQSASFAGLEQELAGAAPAAGR